jgi:hypothetical protein
MSKITVSLSKSELKKLIKKKKKKKQQKKKKTHSHNNFTSVSDVMVRQKPIISQTNPLSQQHYNSTVPFNNNNVLMNPYTTPFNDSRQHGIVIGDLNNANNKIIKIEDDLKKFRTAEQLQGDQDKRDTGKARQYIKKKRNDAVAVGQVFNTLGEQRVMKQVLGLWKQYKDETKMSKIDNTSSSIERPHISPINYFNTSDTIDVATTTPIFKDSVNYVEEDDEDEKEEYIDSPFVDDNIYNFTPEPKKARNPRRTRAEIDMASVLSAEKKSNIARLKLENKNLTKLHLEQERAASRQALSDLKKQNALDTKNAKLNMNNPPKSAKMKTRSYNKK